MRRKGVRSAVPIIKIGLPAINGLNRTLILIVLAAILAITAGLIGWRLTRPPHYDGKTVRAWALLVAAPEPKVREQVRAELKRIGPEAVPVLSQMVEERDPALRSAVWRTAWHLPTSLRWTVLRNVAWTNAVEVRVAAARSLAILGQEARGAIPALDRALHDKEVRVQVEAAGALGHIGRDSVPVLMRALESGDAAIRHAAAYGLGEAGADAEPAVPLLTRALDDRDQLVRASAAYSLSVIQPRLLAPR
jgi:HEAT repeat protein